jgi:hypothetical protein
MTETATRTLWCAYAVVDRVDERALDGLRVVGDADVGVVVGEVPQADYGEDVLPSRLNDREWLERAVTEHESVVRGLLGVGTVVPLRFGSLHRDTRAVEEFLASRRDAFRGALERVRGRVEIGVKVWVAAPAAEAREAQPSTGREYLERRREAREQSARSRTAIDERLRAIHARLLASADEGVLNRPQPRELTGDRREMAMNAAYLVADDESLVAEVERLRSEHPDLVFEVTGPWAPYNFVEEDA